MALLDVIEFLQTKEELKEIVKAKTCIKGKEGYHKYACDGLVIIPLACNKFVKAMDYLK